MKRKRRDQAGQTHQVAEQEEGGAQKPMSANELTGLRDIAGKTWLTYRASPLHAFDEDRLSAYAAGLGQHVAADCQKSVGHRWRFLATAYRMSHLADQHGRATIAFVIGLQSTAGEHTAYPVLLLRGNKITTDSFCHWIYKQFDSRVSQLSFSPYALARMAALWGSGDVASNSMAVLGQEQSRDVLELVYRAPEYIPELTTIRLTIPPEDMRRLATEMTVQGHNLYKEEEDGLAEVRPGLLRALEEHFFHHFRVSLSAFLLYRISTPVAHLNSQGKLKLTQANISLVFQQLALYAQHF